MGRLFQDGVSAAAWGLAFFVLLACAPSLAWARFEIPRVDDAAGLRLGDRATFHGGVALPIGLDTNVFNETSSEEPRIASYIYPTAWLGIGNREVRDGLLMSPAERTARVFDFNVSAIAGFRQYLARDIVVRSQPKFSVGAQVRLAAWPGRRFSLYLDEDFFRGANSGNYELDGRLFNFNRIDHNGDLVLVGRPGGGRIALSFGYHSALVWFSDANLYQSDRVVNGFLHETKWRFLPRSSVFLRYTVDYTYYFCCAETDVGRNEDNFAHRITGGYRGQIAKKLVLDVAAGWGIGLYRADRDRKDFNSFIGEASLEYYPTLQSRIHFEIFRRFQDSLWGNYFVDNGATVLLRHTFRWKMIGHFGATVAGRRYYGLPEPGVDDQSIEDYAGRGSSDLQQQSTLVTLDLGVEQPLGKLFSVALSYNLFVDATDFQVFYTGDLVNDLGYVKNLVWLMGALRI